MKKSDIRKDLDIDVSNINREMVDHPLALHRWGAKLAKAKRVAAKAKARLQYREAKLDETYRMKDEKYTEQQIKMKIRKSKSYRTALAEYNEAEYIVDTLDAAVKALTARTGMLLSLGAVDRKISDGDDLHIMKDKVKRKLVKR
jgi:hypothetical protein